MTDVPEILEFSLVCMRMLRNNIYPINYSIPFRQEAPLGRVLTVFAFNENYDAHEGSSVVYIIGSFFASARATANFPSIISASRVSAPILDPTCCTTGDTVGQSRYARSVGSPGAVTGARHAQTQHATCLERDVTRKIRFKSPEVTYQEFWHFFFFSTDSFVFLNFNTIFP